MMGRVFNAFACMLLVVAGAAAVNAQQFTGGVRGAVRDANGVIPGVTVTLTNEATNISRDDGAGASSLAGRSFPPAREVASPKVWTWMMYLPSG